MDLTWHPPTLAWVPPQQPNIGNQYLSGAQYNNPLYVPYPGGLTNQWDQPTYGLKPEQTMCKHPLWVKMLLSINNLVGFKVNLNMPLVL